MAGLLDYDRPDPLTLGLLGFSQAISTPRSRGGGVAAALGAFPAGQMQAAEMRRKMEADELRKQLAQAQMENYRAASDERKASAEERRAQLAQALAMQEGRQGVLAQLGPQPMGFRDASIAQTGNAPTGYTPPQQQQVQITPDMAARYVANGGKIEDLKGIMEASNFGREAVARVLDRRGADNTPEQVMLDRFGRPVGGAIPKPFEMNMQDIGGSVVPVNPYAPTALTKTMTPDGVASNQVALGNLGVAQANLRLSRERLAFDQRGGADGGLGKPPAGYRWKQDGSGLEFIAGGPADPAKQSTAAPTEDERKAAGWLAQADNAYKNMLGALQKDKGAGSPGFPDAVSGIPFWGNSVGQMIRGEERQKFLQGASSLSEALLRAATGAGVNESEARQKIAELVPQIGDKESLRKQKMDAIPMYLESLRTRSGRAAPAGYRPPTAQSGPSVLPGQPSITDLVNKYAQPR